MEEVHKIFGRHTNVGKMMHTVYNASSERNSYRPEVPLTVRPSNPIQDHEQKLQSMRESIRAKKRAYRLPKKKVHHRPIPKILLQRGRKPQHEIVREYQHGTDLPIYVPAQPRDEVIDDLQCIMEMGKKRSEIKAKLSEHTRCEPMTKKKEIQLRMEELLNEIKERQQFLETMKELKPGDYRQYAQEINLQIKEHIKEFKILDKALTAL